jgi:hypothetical protein
MRPIGFSTGALARGDFRKALRLLEGTSAEAVELSALRTPELHPLVYAVDSLSLTNFAHVSVHAPSAFSAADEVRIVDLLRILAGREWPIVVHPDTIHDFDLWSGFGRCLLVENMDKRKLVGRSAEELEWVFERLPDAGLCLDLAHARQFDPTLLEAHRILDSCGGRLGQVHLSEVSSTSKHTPISYGAVRDFSEVAHRLPSHIPVILESPVACEAIEMEIASARQALPESLATHAFR